MNNLKNECLKYLSKKGIAYEVIPYGVIVFRGSKITIFNFCEKTELVNIENLDELIEELEK